MNIPSLPTDSLYKFFAIGGLALFIGGIYLGVTRYELRRAQWHEIITRSEVFDGEMEALQKKVEPLRARLKKDKVENDTRAKRVADLKAGPSANIEKIRSQLLQLGNPESGKLSDADSRKAYSLYAKMTAADQEATLQYQQILDEIRKLAPEAEQRDKDVSEYVAAMAKLKAQRNSLGTDRQRMGEHDFFDLQIPTVMLLIGEVFALVGFAKWFGHQRTQDALYAKEVKAKNAELDEKLEEIRKREEKGKIIHP